MENKPPGIVAVLLVVAAFVVWWLFVPNQMPSSLDEVGLRHDEAVDRIVTRLAHAPHATNTH